MKIIAITITSILVLLSSNAFAAQDMDTRSRLSLSATGKVQTVPDMAILQAAVISEGKTAKETMAANRLKMNDVFHSLKQVGIKQKDVQTSRLHVTPVYAPFSSDKSKTAQRITGYRVSNQVTITIRNLTQTGIIIDAMIQSGANNISNINFGLQNQETALNQARKLAIGKLLAKARLYARAGGFEIGDILTMSENGSSLPRFRTGADFSPKAMAISSAPTPVSSGEISTSVTVTASFEIVQ